MGGGVIKEKRDCKEEIEEKQKCNSDNKRTKTKAETWQHRKGRLQTKTQRELRRMRQTRGRETKRDDPLPMQTTARKSVWSPSPTERTRLLQ